MPNKNFVAPLTLRNEQFNNSPPEILPSAGLASIFGSESTNVRFSGVDPVREAIAFHIKYALLFVLNVLVVTGFCWHYGASFPIWFLAMAITNYVGYWFLGTTESLLNPHAGHVVRSFFAWLTARDYIRANERLQTQHNLIAYRQLEIRLQEQRNVEQKAIEQVQRHSTPRRDLNRLITYDDSEAFDDEDDQGNAKVQTLSFDDFGKPTDEARTVLLDFITDLYENADECIKPDGSLRRGTVAPWTAKADLPAPVKRKMLDLINQTQPKMFYQEGTRPWQLNVKAYPDADSALDALDTTVTRDV